MKVQLKDIVLAVPALSKLSAGDLQLRLAYKLKRMITALQKEALLSANDIGLLMPFVHFTEE